MPGQGGQHGQQALLDRGRLERGEQDDERPLPAELGDRAGQRGPVGLGDHRLEVGHRVLEVRGHVAGPGGAHPGRGSGGRRPRSRSGRRRGRRGRRAAGRRPWRSRGGARPRPGRPRCARCRGPAPPGGRARAARCGRRPCVVRALARQSIERTSSPRTYSRSESNSVPWPRTRIAARPSSSRSRASRLGRCLRDSNGGSDRTTPGTSRVRCRAARPSGPRGRTVTPSAGRSPRRRGRSGVRRTRPVPGARAIRCRLPVAPAEGCQASRTSARTRRRPGWSTTSTDSAG